MTVLTIAQSVATLVGLQPLASLMADSGNADAPLLREVMHDVLQEVVRAHPWQALSRRADVTASPAEVDPDGGTVATLPLPADFQYFRPDAQLHTRFHMAPLRQILSQDDWVALDVHDFHALVPSWILYGDALRIRPAPDVDTVVSFMYQSSHAVIGADGTTRAETWADGDDFVLPPRLLRLGMIAKYREMAGLSYSEAMQSFQTALAQEIGRDKGAGLRVIGGARRPRDVQMAWPRPIIP